MNKKGKETMKKFYEDMKEQIAKYGQNFDVVIKEYESKIQQVKKDIAQAEMKMNEAMKEGNLAEFTENKNVFSMKKQLLVNWEKELKMVRDYASMDASEHLALKKEVKEYTFSLLSEKYSKLLAFLNEGAVVLDEFEDIVKEYYNTIDALDEKVAGFEKDEHGVVYKVFGSQADDVCQVYHKLNEIFRNDGYRSVRAILQNKIENRYFG